MSVSFTEGNASALRVIRAFKCMVSKGCEFPQQCIAVTYSTYCVTFGCASIDQTIAPTLWMGG